MSKAMLESVDLPTLGLMKIVLDMAIEQMNEAEDDLSVLLADHGMQELIELSRLVGRAYKVKEKAFDESSEKRGGKAFDESSERRGCKAFDESSEKRGGKGCDGGRGEDEEPHDDESRGMR